MLHDSTTRLWARRALGALAILFLLFDGVTKAIHGASLLAVTARIGAPDTTIAVLHVLPLVATIFYALPRSAPPGAIVITAFLGAAIATRLVVGDAIVELASFPVYSAGFVCGGLLLREPRVTQLFHAEGAGAARVVRPANIHPVVEPTVADEISAPSSSDVRSLPPARGTNGVHATTLDRIAS